MHKITNLLLPLRRQVKNIFHLKNLVKCQNKKEKQF